MARDGLKALRRSSLGTFFSSTADVLHLLLLTKRFGRHTNERLFPLTVTESLLLWNLRRYFRD